MARPNFRPRVPAGDFVGPRWTGNQQLNTPRGPNPFVEAAAAGPPIHNLLPIANPRELAQLELEYDSTIPLDKVNS